VPSWWLVSGRVNAKTNFAGRSPGGLSVVVARVNAKTNFAVRRLGEGF
jgi:hypothetical protein